MRNEICGVNSDVNSDFLFDNFFVSHPGGPPQGAPAPEVNPACFQEGGCAFKSSHALLA